MKADKLNPGECVGTDQYMSAMPGRLEHTKGKENKKDKYNGGTIFVDYTTGFVYINHQVSLNAGETVKSKRMFEQELRTYGVKVKSY